MNDEDLRRLLDAGAFDEALAQLGAAAPEDPAATWLRAEIHERRGDRLWFHDRPGAGEAYRAALDALLPRQGGLAGDQRLAEQRQAAWSRVAEKVLYGIGPDGRRRPGATGRPHPRADPAPEPPPDAAACPAPEPTTAAVPAPPAPARDAGLEGGAAAREGTVDEAPPPAVRVPTPAAPPTHPGDRGPLRVGRSYRIAVPFRDFDGTDWAAGTVLVYEGSEYHPRDEGLVLFFDSGTIRLCGLFAADAAVIEHLDRHFVAV
jgi:hypothetical protein